MAPWANLKLRDRLIFSVAVMAASMVLIAALGAHLSSVAYERLNALYEKTNVKTIAGVGLSNAYSKDLVTLVQKLASGAYPWEVGWGRLSEIEDEIRTNVQTLHQAALDDDEKYLLSDIEAKTAVADAFLARLKPVLQKRDGTALRTLSRELYPSVEPVSYRVQLLLNYELGRSKQLARENQAAFHTSYYEWMGLGTLLSILTLSLLVTKHLQRTVSAPLNHLVERMRNIAQGEGDLTKRLEVQSRDEMGQMAEAFNTFIGKLQSVSEMKLDLISVVSHQLKTPVAEINGFIENMLEGLAGEVTVKQREYLEEMRQIGWDNYRLICDLLSASKIERGVITVDLKPVSLQEVVELSTRDYEKLAHHKGLDLFVEGLGEDIRVYADQDKIVEALRNLLNNAIKCTDQGSVTVRLGSEEGNGLIEVRDTGIGMDSETLGRLFTKGRVLGKEAGRSGAGLGLFIGKQFMKLQNGDIRAASEPGKGSCLTLVIPKLKQADKGPA